MKNYRIKNLTKIFSTQLLLILYFAIFSGPVHANHVIDNLIMPPQVTLSNSNLQPIRLTTINIDTEIISSIATSTYELIFFNPNSTILEGQLRFSLLDGQKVVDYALEINGIYRHASVVPKSIGKQAYENTIRRRIDPALLEKTIGNNFSTRLYPLPANGYKRVKITVQEILHSTNNQLQYLIPFLPEDTLDKLSINISIPTLTAPLEPQSGDFIFDNVMHGKVLKLDKSNITINKPILVKINNNSTSSFIQQDNHSKYIFTRIDTPTLETRNPPNKIAILWDTSFSNRLRSLEKEIRFIESYIEKVQTAEIDVFFFNQYLEKKQTLLICAKNISCPGGNKSQKLIDLLKSTKYDGTNDFSSIDVSKINAQEVLLFSNGIKTLFSSDLKNIDKPVSVINSSINANTALLKNYAAISNGRFIDLVKHNDAEAMNQFLSTAAQVRVVSSSAGISADEVFSTKIKNDTFLIIKSQHINNDESEWLIIETTTQSGKTQNTLLFDNLVVVKQGLDKLWGTKKIEKLNIDSANNKEEIIKIAKKYKVLTDDTSLIVLDRVADYVAYEIEPPEELKSQYDKLIKQKINANLYENESAMIESIRALELHKLWYIKKFDSQQEKAERINKLESTGVAFAIVPYLQGLISNVPDLSILADVPDLSILAEFNQIESEADRGMQREVVQQEAAQQEAVQQVREAQLAEQARLPEQSENVSATEPVAANSLLYPKATIKLNEFVPNAAYIKDFKSADKSKWLDEYHSKRDIYASHVMFYVDVAHLFHKNNMKKDAIVILSNILEMEFENSELLRIFAFKALEFKQHEMAILALKKVKNIRPFEPQSFRDLALALNANNEAEEALDNLYYILTHTWSRFPYIKSVVINEFNAILALNQNINNNKFDPRLIYLMPVDLRIVMNWSADNSDIDLHVTDQYNEIVNYKNRMSTTGGIISNDVINGYGPEQFMIKAAHNGVYQIKAHYFGNTQQKLIAPVTVRVKIFSNYSSNNQKQEDIVLRLEQNKRVSNFGYFEWNANKSH